VQLIITIIFNINFSSTGHMPIRQHTLSSRQSTHPVHRSTIPSSHTSRRRPQPITSTSQSSQAANPAILTTADISEEHCQFHNHITNPEKYIASRHLEDSTLGGF
jgi:hypothetical protein